MKRHYDVYNVGVGIKENQNTEELGKKGNDCTDSDWGILEQNSVISSLLNQKIKIAFFTMLSHIFKRMYILILN